MRCAIAFVLGVVFCQGVRADDWPQFRGPTGQGHARGPLPVEWGPDKNIAWKKDIPGLGWSSPVVAGGRVYLTTAVPSKSGAKEVSLRALCLDAQSGNILWDVEAIRQPAANVPKIHSKNSNASPTPIVDGKRLFVHFGHLGTACLDLDGNVLWKNTEVRYAPVHGNGGTPVLVDDLLVFSIDGADKQKVVALDKANGNVKWQTDRKSKAGKKFSFGTPLVIEVDGKQQIISPASDVVGAYDPKTGDEIWRVRYTGYSVIPRPVFGDGVIYLSTSYDAPSLLAIRADGNSKGDVTASHVVWTKKKGAPHAPSPLLDGNLLYFISDSGIATCMDAKKGDVYWSERLDGNFSASPILADGKIYFQSEEGTGFVVKAGTKFELLATNAMNEKSLASYAVADGAIYLRTEKHLYKIEKR